MSKKTPTRLFEDVVIINGRLRVPDLGLDSCKHCRHAARPGTFDGDRVMVRCTNDECGAMMLAEVLPFRGSKAESQELHGLSWEVTYAKYEVRAYRRLAKRWNRKP
jgi:hypothetical protein